MKVKKFRKNLYNVGPSEWLVPGNSWFILIAQVYLEKINKEPHGQFFPQRSEGKQAKDEGKHPTTNGVS